MTAVLAFDDPPCRVDGRLLRSATFVRRSSLPLAAACALANGVREQLRLLLNVDADVELLEPTHIAGDAASPLFAQAWIACATGRLADAYVVFRPRDARRLLAGAFGESGDRAAAFSEIESQVLDRVALALLALCRPLCGALGTAARTTPAAAMQACTTYLEVRAVRPLRAAIGFALTRDPRETATPALRLEDLCDVTVEVRAEVARGAVAVPAMTALRPGATLRLATRLDDPGRLHLGGVRLVLGSCGAMDGRAAFSVSGIDRPSARA